MTYSAAQPPPTRASGQSRPRRSAAARKVSPRTESAIVGRQKKAQDRAVAPAASRSHLRRASGTSRQYMARARKKTAQAWFQ